MADTHEASQIELEVVWPVATQIPDRDAWNVIFEAVRVDGPSPSLYDAVMRVRGKAPDSALRRYADATAVAGVRAAASGSRGQWFCS